MNSTQYLIILIAVIVCFCIYMLVDIIRMNRRERRIRSGMKKIDIYLDEQSARNWGADTGKVQRLTEEIGTRLEGGDGA